MKGVVLEAEGETQTSPHRVQDERGGLQQQHKQQRERLASSSWPLIHGTKSGAENASVSKCNMIKINCSCAGLINLDKPNFLYLASFVPVQPLCIQRCLN